MPFVFFASVSLFYYLLCCLIYSPRASILYFWPLLSLFLFLCIPFPLLWRIFKIPFHLFWALFFLFLFFATRKNRDRGDFDALLVLGVRFDDTLPQNLFFGRVKKAEKLLKENPKRIAILSGGKVFSEKESEAALMRRALLERGIEGERILTEEASRTTCQNFCFSAPLFAPYERVGVITSSYHVFRARRSAARYGKRFLFYSVSAPAFFLPHLLLREFFTFAVEIITGHIKLF